MDQTFELIKHLRMVSLALVIACAALFFAIDITDAGRVDQAANDLDAIIEVRDELARYYPNGDMKYWIEEVLENHLLFHDVYEFGTQHPVYVPTLAEIIEPTGHFVALHSNESDIFNLAASQIPYLDEILQNGLQIDTLRSFRQFWRFISQPTSIRYPSESIPFVLVLSASSEFGVNLSDIEAANLQEVSQLDSLGSISLDEQPYWFLSNGVNWTELYRVHTDSSDFVSPDASAEFSNFDYYRQVIVESNDIYMENSIHYYRDLDSETPLFTRYFVSQELGPDLDLHSHIQNQTDAERVYVIAHHADYLEIDFRLELSQYSNQFSAWRRGSFNSVFDDLIQLADRFEIGQLDRGIESALDLPIDEVRRRLSDMESDSFWNFEVNDSVEILGITLKAQNILRYGVIIILLSQIYFLIHLDELRTRTKNLPKNSEAWEYPWIGLYGGFWSKAFTIVATVVLPVGSQITFTIYGAGQALSWLVAGSVAGLIVGGVTIFDFWRIWMQKGSPLKPESAPA